MTELEKEMLCMLIDARSQIQYLHEKFKETGTGNTAIARIDALVARAEDKAKDPDQDENAPLCVCAHEGWGGEDTSDICPAYVGQSVKLYDVGEREICRHCGHDRACHSSAVEGR